jgi:hypothetical protein
LKPAWQIVPKILSWKHPTQNRTGRVLRYSTCLRLWAQTPVPQKKKKKKKKLYVVAHGLSYSRLRTKAGRPLVSRNLRAACIM